MRNFRLILLALLCWPAAMSVRAERHHLGDLATEEEKKEDRHTKKHPDASKPKPKSNSSKAKSAPKENVTRRRHYPVSATKSQPPQKTSARPDELSQDDRKKKSDELYRSALEATQNGDWEKANKLCKESLKYDPSNLQAQRMSERLDTRRPNP